MKYILLRVDGVDVGQMDIEIDNKIRTYHNVQINY